MRTVQVKLTSHGAGLIMHNNRAVDPLDKYSIKSKPLTSKRKKTIDDHIFISRVEWEAGLYIDYSKGIIAIPSKNIIACLRDGAKLTKNGTAIMSAVHMDEMYIPLDFEGQRISGVEDPKSSDEIPNPRLTKLYEKGFKDRCAMVVQRQTIMRERPYFPQWSLSFVMHFMENIIDEETFADCFRDAGSIKGLMDSRKYGFGKFKVDIKYI